jgi:hypothetical protein
MSETIRPPRTAAQLERLRGMITGAVPQPPIADLIGFRITAADLGRITFDLSLVAKVFSTCTVLRGDDAKGRAIGDA